MQRRSLLLAALGLGGGLIDASRAAGVAPRALVFPADFGAHPETRTEWWYITGELRAGTREFGFQVTFFRARTDVSPEQPSRFAATQLVFAHAAVTDLEHGRLRHDQRIARAGFGIASAAVGDTNVRLRDWSLERSGAAEKSRYRARVRSDSAGFGLALDLASTQPLLLQGEAGYSRKGPGAGEASLYYSDAQLRVGGRLDLDGAAHDVTGRAWLDHEWSDTLLAPDAVGWDWIGMNLEDGSALMAFRIRRKDGSTVWTGGSLRRPGAALQDFGTEPLRFTPLRRWRSPATQAEYPVDWRIETPVGTYEVRARLDDQELDSRGSTGSVYWEGSSDLHDASGRRIGRGYLEMTGYASRLRV